MTRGRATLMVTAATLAACAVTTATDNPRQSAPQFDQIVVPVGDGPGSIAIADVNHDGAPDVLVLNTISQTLSVLLGDGHGHLHATGAAPCATGPQPNDLVLGDFNRDGDLDAAIANTETPRLTILLGDGRGGFRPSPHSPFDTQSFPHVHGVAAGDFTGDGNLDLVTDSWGRDQILLLPGDGAGGLVGRGQPFATGKRPYERLRSGDFNADGHPDIVTTDMDINAVSILLGDGRGHLRDAPGSPFPAGAAPWAVAVDDIDRDGRLDLAVIPYDRDLTSPAQLAVTLLAGDGQGRFAPMRGSPLSLAGCRGPDRVAIGDLLGNGRRGIVVSCAQDDRVMVFAQSTAGTFSSSSLSVQTGWSGLAVGDLNGDGKADIVVSNAALEAQGARQGSTVTIFFNR